MNEFLRLISPVLCTTLICMTAIRMNNPWCLLALGSLIFLSHESVEKND